MLFMRFLISIFTFLSICNVSYAKPDGFTTVDLCDFRLDSTKISRSTLRVARTLAYLNVVKSEIYGVVLIETYEYKNFQKLKRRATKAELIALTNCLSPVVRCYAFWALSLDHPTVDLLPIVLDHIKDTAKVEVDIQDYLSEEAIPVGDFFIDVAKQVVDYDSKKLNSNQMAILDSVLLYLPDNYLLAKEYAIRNIEPTEAIYPRIRELAIEDHYKMAMVKLAQYQKEEDVELILSKFRSYWNNRRDVNNRGNVDYIYMAISEFPHPDFFAILEEISQVALKKEYIGFHQSFYKAIAAYKNEKALDLLKLLYFECADQRYHIKRILDDVE